MRSVVDDDEMLRRIETILGSCHDLLDAHVRGPARVSEIVWSEAESPWYYRGDGRSG